MALSCGETVKASLLKPIGEVHGTSPTPEEEATLLGEVKLPQVPEQLGPWAGTPCRANYHSCSPLPIPSFPTKPPPFPEGKEVTARDQSRHNQCWPVGPCLLRGEWQVAWMVEVVLMLTLAPQWLPQSKYRPANKLQPSSCPLHSKRRMAAELPHPIWRYWGGGNTFPPKDFHGTHNYQEVRKEEMIALAVALQSCVVQLGMPPGVLCGVVQELCQCLAPLLEGDGLPNLETLRHCWEGSHGSCSCIPYSIA